MESSSSKSSFHSSLTSLTPQVTQPITKSLVIKKLENEIFFEKLGSEKSDNNNLYNIRVFYSNDPKIFYFLDNNFSRIKRVNVEETGTNTNPKWNTVFATTENELVSRITPLKQSMRVSGVNFLASTFISKLTKLLKFNVLREKINEDKYCLEKINDQDILICNINEYEEKNGNSTFSMIEELKDGSLIIGVRGLVQFYELQRQWENQEPSYRLTGFYPLPCKTIRMCKIECNDHGTEYIAFSLEDNRIALFHIKGRTEFGKLDIILIQCIDSICGKLKFNPSDMAFVKNLNYLLVCDYQKNPKDRNYYCVLEGFELRCGSFKNHSLQFCETIFDIDTSLSPVFSVFNETPCQNKTFILLSSGKLKKLLIYNFDVNESKIFLIRGKDKGRDAWHYVLVEPRQNILKLNEQKKGTKLNAADYGRIVKSGWGIDPPPEIVKEIEEEFG